MIHVRAYPRIHIALLDLGNVTARRYGGCGFTIESPTVELLVTEGPFAISMPDSLDAQIGQSLDVAIRRLQSSYGLPDASIRIVEAPPQHAGFGTKTSILLAALFAYSMFSRCKLAQCDLQRLCGRGGASGVGIHTFFTGGFVVDSGQPATMDLDFRPSGAAVLHRVPPLAARHNIPSHWSIGLFLADGKRWSGSVENEFFLANTPIPPAEVYQAIAVVLHGIIPAFATGDIALLRNSLAKIHSVGFKARELAAQTAAVQQLYSRLSATSNWAAGLSSMGPLVYVIAEGDVPSLRSEMMQFADREGVLLVGVTRGRNEGVDAY